MQLGECVDAAVERFVSFAGRLEPVAHGMAAHEARAHLLAGELIEKFLLIGDRKRELGSGQSCALLSVGYFPFCRAGSRSASERNQGLGCYF